MRVDLSNPEAVVRRYYLFRAMAAVGFVSPVFALFVLRDLTYAQYGTLSAVYSLLLVGGEIPTGYLGDRFGRRDTLVASKVALAASLLGFVAVDSFGSYLVVYVLWALGMALTSGTGSAWLYEVLDSTLGAEQFTTVRGKGNAIARWSAAVTMILGALLYDVDPATPFVAAGALMLVGAAVIATLPRTEQFADRTGIDGDATDVAGGDDTDDASDEDDSDRAGPDASEAVDLIRERIARPPLRSFVLLVALLFGVVGAGNQYVQPAAVAVADDVDLGSALPVGAWIEFVAGSAIDGIVSADLSLSGATGLGPLYASFALVGAALSYHAGAVEERIGLRRVLVIVAAIVVGVFLVPLAIPVAAFVAFYVSQGVRHLLRPMVERYVNDRVGDVGRATVLSAVSMVFGLARTPFVVLAGFAAGAWGPVAAYGALAVLFIATAVPLALLGSPLPATEAADRGTAPTQ